MRPRKLSSAAMAAGAALALLPAAASALPLTHAHASVRRAITPTGCHISLFAEPHQVTSGEKVEAFGALACPAGEEAAGQTVTAYAHTAGIPGYTVAGTTTTGVGGAYAFPATTVTADTTVYVTVLGARSAARVVRVAPQVTVTGAPEGTPLITGFRHPVTFIGTVSPADAGAEVVLEREQATAVEEWGVIQQRNYVQSNGTYSITHHFLVPGDANLRVVVRVRGRYTVRGTSNTLSYEISQAQNPRLTIASSSNPLSYGSPTTISGIYDPTPVAGSGAGQKLILTARTAGNPLFTQVAETTTNGSGDYQFTIPSETNNTAYEVKTTGTSLADKVSSSALYEGVKYILTAGVSSNTIQAGQPLTWSGTVTPGVSGKFVYLERLNGNGQGFHVVDVAPEVSTGAPGSPGTYTISYVPRGVGNQIYRVRVPGDPTNQAIASPTFVISVTPAPLGSLRPRPQSTLPS